MNTKLKRKMHEGVDTVFSRWQRFVVGEEKCADTLHGEASGNPDFRTVALVAAIERVANATLMRGSGLKMQRLIAETCGLKNRSGRCALFIPRVSTSTGC